MSRLEDAIWAGDVDTLNELVPCICCCAEHTFDHCRARAWGGCRGGDELTPHAEAEVWAAHYAKFHSMSREEFFR